MKVDVKIRHGLDQILKEMGTETTSDIMVLKAKDKFFVGNGCEYSGYHELPDDLRANKQYLLEVAQNSKGNISVCKCR